MPNSGLENRRMNATATILLGQIAHARSGDKGNHANIGVVAYTPAGFDFLRRELTADRVARFFAGLVTTKVDRYELPNVGAINFVLHDALAGGASQSLRIDTQGKLLGTAILDLALPAPAGDDLAKMTPVGEIVHFPPTAK